MVRHSAACGRTVMRAISAAAVSIPDRLEWVA